MAKKIKITEAQYKALYESINEVTPGENFTAIPNDKKDFSAVARNLASNPNTDDAKIAVGTASEITKDPSKVSGLAEESYIISKKEIDECKSRFINENSKLYSYNDFISQIKK